MTSLSWLQGEDWYTRATSSVSLGGVWSGTNPSLHQQLPRLLRRATVRHVRHCPSQLGRQLGGSPARAGPTWPSRLRPPCPPKHPGCCTNRCWLSSSSHPRMSHIAMSSVICISPVSSVRIGLEISLASQSNACIATFVNIIHTLCLPCSIVRLEGQCSDSWDKCLCSVESLRHVCGQPVPS